MIDEHLFEYDLLEEEDGSTLTVETEQNKRVALATLQKWGSDVYGLPSRETYPDSQIFRSDGAKIKTYVESSKLFSRKM